MRIEKLDILFLVSKHEAYTSQRMERIYMTPRCGDSASNLNPNKINNMVALAQNDGARSGMLRTKRWQNRKRLEILERHQNASRK